MALDADTLVDRRRLKRQLAGWRAVAVVALVAVAALGVVRFAGFPHADHVAQVWITGVITDDEPRRTMLAELARDPSVKAVILRIDSPGGTVVGGESLYQSIREIGHEKPVVAVMGQMATSAGYMVALAADHLVAHRGTLTGSIGVILQTADVTQLLESIGIKPETFKSGPLKAQPSPFEPTTPPVREATQRLVDSMFEMFVGMVAERRGIPRERLLAEADGRVYTGLMALDAGLIDAIGDPQTARAWLTEARGIASGLPVYDVAPEREVGDLLYRVMALVRKTLFSELLTLDGLVSLWHPEPR